MIAQSGMELRFLVARLKKNNAPGNRIGDLSSAADDTVGKILKWQSVFVQN